MYKSLFFLFLLYCNSVYAQNHPVMDGMPADSVTISFEANDSIRNNAYAFMLDTASCKLWQIGTTSKPYFAAGHTSSNAIMTDTLHPYDTNRNESFTLILGGKHYNRIIGFTHKYETDSGRDACIVEFSTDTGKSWMNVVGACNYEVPFGMRVENFYTKTDTLADGQPAFYGSSNGWRYSRMQLFNHISVKTTGTVMCVGQMDVMYRFRFVSDSIPDNKAGWIIDDIKLEYDHYGSGISIVDNSSLPIYPVPVTDGIIHFPQLERGDKYRIVITDIAGRVMMNVPYTTEVNISGYPQGMYYYKVSNGEEVYTGKIPKQ